MEMISRVLHRLAWWLSPWQVHDDLVGGTRG